MIIALTLLAPLGEGIKTWPGKASADVASVGKNNHEQGSKSSVAFWSLYVDTC